MKKRIIFWFVIVLVPVLVSFVFLELSARALYYQKNGPHTLAIRHLETTLKGLSSGMLGNKLPRLAWDASFTESGLVAPESGPRDGFWGRRTSPKNNDCGALIVCERDQFIEGLVDIRDNGLQYAGNPDDDGPRILIIGGSVAWGAYSSGLDTTYYHLLWKLLSEHYKGVSVTVLARGAARSDDDLAALILRGLALKPDMVVFLNGLNDIYIPSAEGERMDYRKYVRNMEIARRVAIENDISFYVALQPFPHGKINKSRYEKAMLSRIEVAGFPGPESVEVAREFIRGALQDMTAHPMTQFMDCSTTFDNEQTSIFTDQWHFADRGNKLMAQCLNDGLLEGMSQSDRWSPEKSTGE